MVNAEISGVRLDYLGVRPDMVCALVHCNLRAADQREAGDVEEGEDLQSGAEQQYH